MIPSRVPARRVLALAALLLPVGAAALPLAAAPTPASIIRVEEDWVLVVNEPNTQTVSPQVSTQMTPGGGSTVACNGQVNFQDYPQFTPGGLQMLAWQGTTLLSSLGTPTNVPMFNANETVSWTQYLQTGSPPVFGAKNFTSKSWGIFPAATIPLTGVTLNLAPYSAQTSVQNSGISLGSNRVTSFTLKAVRTYYSDGSVKTDSTAKVVFPAQ